MSRLRLQFAKSRPESNVETSSRTLEKQKEQSVPVKIEVDNDTGLIILRGPQPKVEKVKAIIDKVSRSNK